MGDISFQLTSVKTYYTTIGYIDFNQQKGIVYAHN